MNYHADDCEEQLLESHPGTLIDLRERTNMIQLAGSYRQALAHFCALHHVGVFPSIHPETFEIVCRRNDGVWAKPGEKQLGRDRQTGRRWPNQPTLQRQRKQSAARLIDTYFTRCQSERWIAPG